jgi:hypothetical protein
MLTRKYRRRHYQKLLRKYALDAEEPYVRFKHLVSIWRRIRWSDYNGLPVDILLGLEIQTRTDNLPQLVDRLEEVNQWISEGRDGRIENENKNRKTLKQKTLDSFLSDNESFPIEVGDHLRRMAGQLQILAITVDEEYRETKGDYYPRICDYVLYDVIELTETIIEGGTIEK